MEIWYNEDGSKSSYIHTLTGKGVRFVKESRREQYAAELKAVCELIDEGPSKSSVGDEKGHLSRLITLCSMVGGTESLRDHLRNMLMTGMMHGLPKHLLIDPEKGPKEFERKQILVNQLFAIQIALALGYKKRAKKIARCRERWRRQFKEVYGEPVESGVNMEELARDLKSLKGTRSKDSL